MKLAKNHCSPIGRELSLEEVQKGALDVLKRIDAICEKEGLHYWVAFGTLIGAIRHKGFVPWDDDLDIMMPRPDYERLLAYFVRNANAERPLVALDPRLGKNQPFLITRISDTRYKMAGEYGDLVDGLGTFVDVYPLDGMGNDFDAAKKHEFEAYGCVCKYVQALNPKVNSIKPGIFRRFVRAVRASLLGNPSKYQARLMKLCAEFSYEESDYVAVAAWPSSPNTSVYPRGLFDGSERVSFEDISVPVPIGYDEVLKSDFGDYMQLPPVEMRRPHKTYSIYRVKENK